MFKAMLAGAAGGVAVSTKPFNILGELFELFAAPYRWRGSFISVRDGNWNNSRTWNSNVVPGESEHVVIRHDVILVGVGSCKGFTVARGGTLRLGPRCQQTTLEIYSEPGEVSGRVEAGGELDVSGR